MEVKNEKIIAAYQSADESGKKLLEGLFPGMNLNKKDERPVTERIKTLEDAMEALGAGNRLVEEYIAVRDKLQTDEGDLIAYLKLRIAVAALNEGWEPEFTENEKRWYPWQYLWTAKELKEKDEEWKKERASMPVDDYVTEYAGFAFAISHSAPSRTSAPFGSRLCLKNSELATYCGKQFINLLADFKLLRKK